MTTSSKASRGAESNSIEGFAVRMRSARKAKQLTQFQLAYESGISVRQIAGYEGGDILPGAVALKKLSAALGCSADHLLGGDSHAETLAPAAAAGGAR